MSYEYPHIFEKDPDANLPYSLNWTEWLGEDTIEDAEWFCEDEAIELTNQAVEGAYTQVWVAGGEVDNSYTVTCRVTSAAGKVDDRSLFFVIVPR